MSPPAAPDGDHSHGAPPSSRPDDSAGPPGLGQGPANKTVRGHVIGEAERGRCGLAGILSLAFLALLVTGGTLAAWVLPGRPAGKNAREVIAERQRQEAERRRTDQGSIEERFQGARQQLLKENFAGAQDGFSELTRRSGLTRPQADWVRFHLILASLLNQDLENAQGVADAETRAGPFSREEADRPLANSLETMAKAFGKPSQAIPASTASLFQKDGPEAFAPLLFGLKDLELGVTDDALRILQGFLGAKPTGAYGWIADYQPLVEKLVRDLRVLGNLRGRLKDANTAAKQGALLAEFDRAKAQLQTEGKMVELFDLSAGILRQQLENARRDEAGGALARETAQNDADRDRWQAARETAQSAIRVFRYEEALATLRRVSTTLKGADFIAARDALVERTTRLLGFKTQLITDLNAGAGRGEPISTRNGTAYPQGIARADMAGVRAVVASSPPAGEVPLAWTDVNPRALVRLAGRVADAKAAADPRDAAERRWLAATFAQEVGLFPEARALAERAARDRPEYREKLDQFK